MAKVSSYDELSSCPALHFISQNVAVVTGGTPALDLNPSYKDDSVGEKEMKGTLGGTAQIILEPLRAREWRAQSDGDRQNSGRDLSYVQKKWVWRRDRLVAHG